MHPEASHEYAIYALLTTLNPPRAFISYSILSGLPSFFGQSTSCWKAISVPSTLDCVYRFAINYMVSREGNEIPLILKKLKTRNYKI